MGWIRNAFVQRPKNYGEYYVYALLDPRTGKPFYIGKGSKDRMYEHEKELRRILARAGRAKTTQSRRGALMSLSCKHKRILEILESGEVDASCQENCIPTEVLYRTDEEGDAYRAERYFIEEAGIEYLTNEVYGYSDKAIDRLIRRRLQRSA